MRVNGLLFISYVLHQNWVFYPGFTFSSWKYLERRANFFYKQPLQSLEIQNLKFGWNLRHGKIQKKQKADLIQTDF